ncbi:MAG: hypothetical protein ABWX74_13125 [Aeromicrobium sp.]
MSGHIIDELRPEPLDVDAGWDEQTRLAIMSDRLAARASDPRWPTRLLVIAAAAALMVGGVVAAQRWLPREDVIVPAAPQTTSAEDVVFAETAKAMATMDGIATELPTDHTSNATGSKDFPLGKAPADAYIYFKIGLVCVGKAKYEFGVNGDFRGAGANCDADRSVSGSSYEFPERVVAGSVNELSIRVDRPLRYTVAVGYRTKSIHDVGPRGTLPDGRTYGYQEDGVADMVLVHGVSGMTGYVDRDDLNDLPSSPEEALREQRERRQRYRDGERIDRTVPVYDANGKQVDVFNVMVPDPR